MDASPRISRTEPAPAAAAPDPLAPDPLAPVVVTGMARSGSSLVCLILNRAGPGLVINDAYAAQMAEALGAPGPLGGGDLAALPAFRAAARARIEARGWDGPGPAPIHRSARLDGAMRAAADAADGGDWARLWGAMLHSAACEGGRPLWGWNSAPDHLRADDILAAFPCARFLFVMRDPWAMLRSYAALPPGWGRERGRYHPFLQARAWAAAMRSHDRLVAARPGQIHLLPYEALRARPRETLAELARFLGLPRLEADPAALPANPSASEARLTRAEIAAARLGLGREAARAGPPPAPQGV
ncbi:MAG: sulfotransferase family protein, partial [Pseudomonadota bacterium]